MFIFFTMRFTLASPAALMLGLFRLSTPASLPSPICELRGTLRQAPPHTTVYLVSQPFVVPSVYLDSAVVAPDGTFRLRGRVAQADLYQFQVNRSRYGQRALSIPIPVVPSQHLRLTADAPTVAASAQLTGSAEANAVMRWLAVEQSAQVRSQQLIQRYAASGNGTQAGAPTAAEWTNAHIQTGAENRRFVRQHPRSLVAPAVVVTLSNEPAYAAFVDSMTTYLARTRPTLAATRYLVQRQRVVLATSPGHVAPDLRLPSLLGTPVALSSLRGHYVLLDFWASWCAPCREKHPHLRALYRRYQPKGLAVYSVSLDESARSWAQAVAADSLPWVNVSDLRGFHSPAAIAYAAQAIPYTLLLDPEGRIIAKNLRPDELDRQLAALFP